MSSAAALRSPHSAGGRKLSPVIPKMTASAMIAQNMSKQVRTRHKRGACVAQCLGSPANGITKITVHSTKLNDGEEP
jgi:hypothetical protein